MAPNDHLPAPAALVLPAARIAHALEREGWCVVDDALDPATAAALAANCRAHSARGELRAGRTGHEAVAEPASTLRGDRIRWLAAVDADGSEAALLAALDGLRAGLNSRLYLGLAELEAHYACYPPGARYALHRDRFRDDDRRVVSLVLYLNPDWCAAQGGVLRLHLDATRGSHCDVLPQAGRIVCFMAADFEHEVLPATRERLSIAAWFLRRALPA